MNAAQRRRILRNRPAAGQRVRWSEYPWHRGSELSEWQEGTISESDRWNTLFRVRVDFIDIHGQECWREIPIAKLTLIQEPKP